MSATSFELNAIETDKIWVKYNHQAVLYDVNLTVKDKDFLGIIGPNGGGKTTLLKVILGLIKPYSGSVRIFGRDVIQGRSELGYVPQYAHFDYAFPISVEEVVLLGRVAHKKGRRFSDLDRVKASEALKRVGLYDLCKRQIAELSGGQRQRALVARALASEPRILLLDEPTASVDEHFAADFYELLVELNKEMTIVMVSHDISAVSRYVKTLACLNGTLFHQGSKELTNEILGKVYNCPVDLIAHGVPHRVLTPHDGVVGH